MLKNDCATCRKTITTAISCTDTIRSVYVTCMGEKSANIGKKNNNSNWNDEVFMLKELQL